MKLKLEPHDNARPDDIYARLNALGRGRTDRESRRALAAVVFLLANHIGDDDVVEEAIALVGDLPALGSS